jgi:hypothetical protein
MISLHTHQVLDFLDAQPSLDTQILHLNLELLHQDLDTLGVDIAENYVDWCRACQKGKFQFPASADPQMNRIRWQGLRL